MENTMIWYKDGAHNDEILDITGQWKTYTKGPHYHEIQIVLPQSEAIQLCQLLDSHGVKYYSEPTHHDAIRNAKWGESARLGLLQ